MIPAAANIPLTLCSVVIRRFIDSYTGRLPLAAAASAAGVAPSVSTVALFSGALFCLYHQLRKGTLVKIGMGRRISSMIKNSRHTIQRRVKNSSWFLRNLAACRRKCTEAMFRMAHQSNDSLRNIKAETGIVAETNSLPVFNRTCILENRRRTIQHEPLLENLYSNDSFESCDGSKEDLRMEKSKREHQLSNPKRRSYNHFPNRPITRNFRKCIPEDNCGDGRNRLPSRKRKKSELVTINESDNQPLSVAKNRSEVKRELSKRLVREPSVESQGSTIPLKEIDRRYSERLRKNQKVQKITRKTRSGRVYAYRL